MKLKLQPARPSSNRSQ